MALAFSFLLLLLFLLLLSLFALRSEPILPKGSRLVRNSEALPSQPTSLLLLSL